MFLELLRENGVEDKDIGVIAPYLGQRDLLQEYFFYSISWCLVVILLKMQTFF